MGKEFRDFFGEKGKRVEKWPYEKRDVQIENCDKSIPAGKLSSLGRYGEIGSGCLQIYEKRKCKRYGQYVETYVFEYTH